MRFLPAAGRVVTSWRNGAGATREIVAAGGAEFDWRLSIAVVAGEVEFSRFPLVDRMLVPLSPEGLQLRVDGIRVELAQWQVLGFAGEVPVTSLSAGGVTEDLNLMVRRGVAHGQLVVHAIAGTFELEAAPGESVVVVVLEGSLGYDACVLGRHDAILLDATETVALNGTGEVAVARIG